MPKQTPKSQSEQAIQATERRRASIEVLEASEFEYEREVARIAKDNLDYPVVPSHFTQKLLSQIYAGVEEYNKQAAKTIQAIEDNYNAYLKAAGLLTDEPTPTPTNIVNILNHPSTKVKT